MWLSGLVLLKLVTSADAFRDGMSEVLARRIYCSGVSSKGFVLSYWFDGVVFKNFNRASLNLFGLEAPFECFVVFLVHVDVRMIQLSLLLGSTSRVYCR